MNKKEPSGFERIVRDSTLVEYVCEHGVGHPDRESAIGLAEYYGHANGTWMVHGCCGDGCCRREDFPGK